MLFKRFANCDRTFGASDGAMALAVSQITYFQASHFLELLENAI